MSSAPLLLLLSSALLSSHLRPVAGRARALPAWMTEQSGRLHPEEELLLRAAAAAAAAAAAGSGPPPPPSDALDAGRLVRLLLRRDPEQLHLPPAAEPLLKRSEEPPLSIDLTFHLLRNMIHMAKLDSQRQQAIFNQDVLDEVGK